MSSNLPIAVGTELPSQILRITRERLVKYAGASGDFNVIHWNDRAAAMAGLPGVISHGMLTMAEAIRVVTAWTGNPDSVLRYRTRFSRPLIVPDTDEGVQIEVTGVLTGIYGDTAEVAIRVLENGTDLLSDAIAVVRTPRT